MLLHVQYHYHDISVVLVMQMLWRDSGLYVITFFFKLLVLFRFFVEKEGNVLRRDLEFLFHLKFNNEKDV